MDQTIIQTIGAVYYSNNNSFSLDHLTQKLPSELTTDYINELRERLENQMHAVTRKASELILKGQPSYAEQMQAITNL